MSLERQNDAFWGASAEHRDDGVFSTVRIVARLKPCHAALATALQGLTRLSLNPATRTVTYRQLVVPIVAGNVAASYRTEIRIKHFLVIDD